MEFDKQILVDNAKLFKIYKETFLNRQKGDYDFTYELDENDLKLSIKDVKVFVKTIKNYIQN